MKRREFITLLGGAAAAWPLAARAQQGRAGAAHRRAHEPRRGRSGSAGPPRSVSCKGCSNWAGRSAAICGSTIAGARAMPTAFADTRRNWSRSLPTSSWQLPARPCRALLQATRTVPIVFAQVPDPVGAGFVDSLARPGGNVTGFTNFDYSMGGKCLELLKEIAPRVTRAAVLRDAGHTRRDRPVGRNPDRSALVWGGVEPGRCA